MDKRNHPTPDTLNQLDLLGLPGVSGFDLDQPQPATASPAPTGAGAALEDSKRNTPTAILAEIQSAANSLEIFAWATTDKQFPSDHQSQMQEAALMMLERLEELHGELKQAIAVEVAKRGYTPPPLLLSEDPLAMFEGMES